MASYPSPNLPFGINNIFNSQDFPQSFSSDTQNVNFYDNRYLKKISDDTTSFNLTTKGITTNNLNVSSQKRNYKTIFPTLFSYYDFSEKSDPGYDASGNNRPGLSNNLLYFDNYQGKQNCLYFNQAAGLTVSNLQKIDLTQYVSTFRTKQNVSISFWIRIDVVPIATSCIFSMTNTGANNRGLEIWISGNTNILNARLRYGTTATWQLSGTLTVGSWNHVVLTMGAFEQLWINNILVSLSGIGEGPSFIPNADSMLIGASRDNTGYKWSFGQGYLHDFMIWDQQLLLSFIGRLYNGLAYPGRIFIMAGQSNMCGRGVLVPGVDDNYSKLYNRVLQYGITTNMNNDGTLKSPQILTPSTNPLDFADIFPGYGSSGTVANTISLFRTFCENLIASNSLLPQERIILIPMAKGSTGFLNGDWSKSDNLFYTALISAFNSVKSMNSNYSLGAMFWIQGESDSFSPIYYADYLQKFYNNLLIDIPELNNNCPFICGEINGVDQNKNFINTILNNFADNKKKFIVKSSGLPTNTGDTTHFNNVAQREIGNLFCNQYINYISGVDFDSAIYSNNLLSSSITTDNLLVNNNLNLDAPINLINNNAFIQDLVSNDGINNINSKWLYKQLASTTTNDISKGVFTQTFNDTSSSNNSNFYLYNFNLQTIGSSAIQNVCIKSQITISQYCDVSPFHFTSESFELELNILKNSTVAGGTPSTAQNFRLRKTDKTNINNSRTRGFLYLNNENLPNNISNIAVYINSYNNSVPALSSLIYTISTVNEITITALNYQTINLILNSLNTELSRSVPSFISSPPSPLVLTEGQYNSSARVKYAGTSSVSLNTGTDTILPLSTTSRNEFWNTVPSSNAVVFPYIGSYRVTIYANTSAGGNNQSLKIGYKLSGFPSPVYVQTITETTSGTNPVISTFYITITSVLTTSEFYLLSSHNDSITNYYILIEYFGENVLSLF